ncbi:molybdopterin-synthase adenylyltransferase MoeB [Cyclobacterium xiamenense]|uniref:molybdopterin-synthase adenylyltransferase MoeB n=1 Tax=Cyclobacterium xiamenense TaxID=1297121 RepID=UPI001F50908D|nr:molybdopterin-synthase adenylyltransferase MoeB [Cyclobacterium xiamenense]
MNLQLMMNDRVFSDGEFEHYSRQFALPQFGPEAQEKLKNARVLVVGSGGLGSPLLLYLAAAGVGQIGIVDFDRVDASNLHRQVIFDSDQIGKPKVLAAKNRLERINPYIRILTYEERLTSANALHLIAQYDVVADGTDNFPTRYLVNDACVLAGKPNVYGSVYQFEGQVAVFNFRDKSGGIGPNYRDIYPSPPPAGLVPNCAESGILGVLPGIIGSMQALEVIKVITGIGEVLSGKLALFDALGFSSRVFVVKRRPDNPLNGDRPTQKSLIDYEAFCGLDQLAESKGISVEKFHELELSTEPYQLIDVREPYEYQRVNIGGLSLPLSRLEEVVGQIDRDKKVVVHCEMGSRSARAIQLLEKKHGFTNLINLKGGIQAYLATYPASR